MDSYYLTKDDFDGILELGVGPRDMEKIKIESATKAAFTRTYNIQSHPMPFVKASNVLGMTKGGASKRDKPDLEEAVDESEAEELLDPVDEEDDELDLKKDKYIKAPKKKPATAAKGKGKRKKGEDEDDEVDDSEDKPKPKKAAGGGGRGGRKGKGRA